MCKQQPPARLILAAETLPHQHLVVVLAMQTTMIPHDHHEMETIRRKSKGVDNSSLHKGPSSQINNKGHRINNKRSKFLFHTMFLLELILQQGAFLECLREAQDTLNL